MKKKTGIDGTEEQQQMRTVDVGGVKVDAPGDVTDAEVAAWMERIAREDAEDEKKNAK